MLVPDQLQQGRQVVGIILCQGEPDTDFYARIPTQTNAVQRFFEGTALATKAIMGLFDTVQADTDIIETNRRDRGDIALVDQGTVRRQTDIKAHVLRVMRDFKNIRPEQRLPTGQNEYRNPERLEIVHHVKDFGSRQFARKVLVGRDRIAMLAGQVATPDQVPDHNRTRRIALGSERRGVCNFLHVL